MLKIRLKRTGRKHDPSYQVIVTEKGRAPQTGAYKEKLGTYDPRSDEHDLRDERIEHWLSEGAQPSDTVHNLLVKAGILEEETVNPLPNKSPVEGEPEESEEAEEKDTDETKSDTADNADQEEEQEVDDEASEEDESSEHEDDAEKADDKEDGESEAEDTDTSEYTDDEASDDEDKDDQTGDSTKS